MGLKATLGLLGSLLLAFLGARLYWRSREKKAIREAQRARERALAAGNAAAVARADRDIERIKREHAAQYNRERSLPMAERLRRAYERAVAAGYPGDGDGP